MQSVQWAFLIIGDGAVVSNVDRKGVVVVICLLNYYVRCGVSSTESQEKSTGHAEMKGACAWKTILLI